MRASLWIVVLLANIVGGGLRAGAAADRPNVIVLLADDQRAQDLGLAGHPVLKTPNIDALAHRGTYFSEAFATSPICTPSRTCILLGEYERRHGVTFGSRSALTSRAFGRTYPMVLREAGYFTGYVGKNHTPIGKSAKGVGYVSGVMEKGFDSWYGAHGHLGFYPKKSHKIFASAQADTQVEILEEGALCFLGHSEECLADSKRFLATRPKDQPFCLLVNFNVPHGNGTGSMKMLPSDPELYRTTYQDQMERMPIPSSYVAAKDITTPKIPSNVYNGRYIPSYDYVKTPASLRQREMRECQTISGIDRMVGHIVDELERQGIADKTIIVYTSDHGIQHGEYGLGGKTLLYDPSLRVPLIVCDPRMPKERLGARVEQMALSVDIAPTLLELCGVEPPAGIQGRSLAPLMRGEAAAWREDFFCENMFTGQNYPRIEGVRSRQWKYIRYFDHQKNQAYQVSLSASIQGERPIYEELFDLVKDPDEKTNLVADPTYADTLAVMARRCQALVTELRGDEPPDTYTVNHRVRIPR